ncbi:unnamed protein product [Cylindrotheca closterium]|uniref:C2H2-type domain-containing protein n=1 Tax=Cylindrotheca closterium TaxID=2856 RepID=A0AAD2CQW9_9STRA|nr:unnamed protein product [Cylindrotheca closterium]
MASTLISTTAPGKVFSSRSELAEHYKSDWHKYNLKRREAGLPLLAENDFVTRWEAALALKREKDAKAKRGKDHIKNPEKKNKQKSGENKISVNESIAASQENPEINPYQSIFDSKSFDSLEENVSYMNKNYGFFIPDSEHLTDLEGLLGYCHEKVKLGHYCLYCSRVFPTWQGCQNHMISTRHTKLRYEQGFWEELDPFYDFTRDNQNFMGDSNNDEKGEEVASNNIKNIAVTDDDDEDWEDVSETGDDDDDSAREFRGYEKEIARFGLDITPLGELVFPDGRIVGHRALHKYYKQNIRSTATNDAVVAAKTAAGERMYEGRVVNIKSPLPAETNGGSGKGILVPLKGGPEAFSALSLYRYTAAVRKQRVDDDKGRRLKYRTTQNMNRMDKKANRLMNGVSVAHAAR